jgi:hypothetical protein
VLAQVNVGDGFVALDHVEKSKWKQKSTLDGVRCTTTLSLHLFASYGEPRIAR